MFGLVAGKKHESVDMVIERLQVGIALSFSKPFRADGEEYDKLIAKWFPGAIKNFAWNKLGEIRRGPEAARYRLDGIRFILPRARSDDSDDEADEIARVRKEWSAAFHDEFAIDFMKLPEVAYDKAFDNTGTDSGKSVKVKIDKDGEFEVKAS